MATIRPAALSDTKVLELILKVFGLHGKTVRELTAYDDRNYLVVCATSRTVGAEHEDGTFENGEDKYVFKVTNAKDSVEKFELMQHQVKLLQHLTLEGFRVPESVATLDDASCYLTTVDIDGTKHAIRLFKYIEGDVWANVPKGKNLNVLFYKAVGKFCAQLNIAMQKFMPQDMFAKFSCEWHLDKVWVTSKEYITDVVPASKREMLQKIFHDFDEIVLAHMDTFEMGLIHSDLNDNNILVNAPTNDNVIGVIDFNEVTVAPFVFELAIVIADAMGQNIMAGKYVLDGYLEQKQLPQRDLNVLSHCIRARCAQCLLLCAHASTLDPTNTYLTDTSACYWNVLDAICDNNKELMTLWD